MNKRLFRSLLILLLLGFLLGGAFLYTSVRPLPVQVARPQTDVAIQVFGLGTVEARVLSKVGFEVGAALVELHADHGDLVQEGDLLARLHAAEQEARVAKAKAGLATAEAKLRTAEAAVGKARAVLAQRQQSNRRKQALVAQRTVSEEIAEEAQTEEDVARAELEVAASELEVAKAGLEDAEAQYAYEQVLLDHHELRAPYDAIVVARHQELGTVLTPGEPLFTLADPKTIWALAYVDEARAGRIELDQPAEVRLRSLPGEVFRGHVARIGIESDRVSEERRVYVACDQCPARFHLGEQAEITLTTSMLDEALLVPETAIIGFDGAGGSVWTVEDGKLRQREVELGARTLDAEVEIVAGLPTDALVVVDRPSGLREGRTATVREDGHP